MNDDAPVTYESLKKFFFVILNAQFDVNTIAQEERPAKLLESYEAKGPRAAMKVLRTDVSVMVVPLATMPAEQVKQISAKLLEIGAPSISMVKAWLRKGNVSIFERRKIVSDDEFQRLSTLLDTGDLNDQEAALVQSMVDAYEFGQHQT